MMESHRVGFITHHGKNRIYIRTLVLHFDVQEVSCDDGSVIHSYDVTIEFKRGWSHFEVAGSNGCLLGDNVNRRTV